MAHPGLWARSPIESVQEATTHCCFTLSPSLLLSLKINKIFFFLRLKNSESVLMHLGDHSRDDIVALCSGLKVLNGADASISADSPPGRWILCVRRDCGISAPAGYISESRANLDLDLSRSLSFLGPESLRQQKKGRFQRGRRETGSAYLGEIKQE